MALTPVADTVERNLVAMLVAPARVAGVVAALETCGCREVVVTPSEVQPAGQVGPGRLAS